MEWPRSDALTWRDARRWIAVLFAVLAGLPLVAILAQNERVLRGIRRVNAAGGLVASWPDTHSSTAERWLEESPEQLQRRFVVRPRYAVFFGRVPMAIGPTLGDSAPVIDTRGMEGDCGNAQGRVGDPGDDGLETLGGLGRMVLLSLVETSVSDAGLRHLRHADALKELDLEATEETGPGLEHLRRLPLRWLSLRDTRIDDRALVHVAAIETLEYLSLGITRVTGAGVAELATLPALQTLDLSQTYFADDDLRHLAGLPVTTLGLSETGVTDAGLAHLERLPRLRFVILCGTRVTREGLERLRSSGRDWSLMYGGVDCGPFTSQQAIRRARRPR
jgi:hypothetical protein